MISILFYFLYLYFLFDCIWLGDLPNVCLLHFFILLWLWLFVIVSYRTFKVLNTYYGFIVSFLHRCNTPLPSFIHTLYPQWNHDLVCMIHRKETSQTTKGFVVFARVCYDGSAIHHPHLSLHPRCMHVVGYISLLSLTLITPPFTDGDTRNHASNKVGKCEEVKDGDDVMMEVDLRGEGRERTLHFFIEGRQQKIYFYNLPSTVEFCVCILSLVVQSLTYFYSIIIPCLPSSLPSSPQFYLQYYSEWVEFLSLEEARERMSKDGIEGESGQEFWERRMKREDHAKEKDPIMYWQRRDTADVRSYWGIYRCIELQQHTHTHTHTIYIYIYIEGRRRQNREGEGGERVEMNGWVRQHEEEQIQRSHDIL